MAINPNIALRAQVPQTRGPLETYGRAQQIAANAMAMEKAARDMAAVNAARRYAAEGGTFATPEDMSKAVAMGVPPEMAQRYLEVATQARKTATEARATVEERLLARLPRIAETNDDAGWQRFIQDWGANVDKDDAEEMLRLSGGRAQRNILMSIMAGAQKYFEKNTPAAVASVQFAPGGEAFGVTVGGTGAPRAEQVVVNSRAGAPAATTPAPAASGTAEAPALTPQEAGPILQNATQTQTISEQDAARVRRSLGPQGQPQFDRWLRDNRIQVLPMAYTGSAGEAAPPPMRTAEYRTPERDYFSNPGVADYPVENAPVNALRQNVVNEVGTQFRGRDPMQSPMPGSATVPLPRVKDEAQAGAAGQGEVDVVVKPKIAAGTAAATNKVELQKNLPKARGALNLATAQLDRDIADIDYVLRNPYREMVVGKIEGRLPSAVNMFRGIGSDIDTGQQAQNVQDRLDKIGAKSVVTYLQQMREASPQGSSLFGQVTEYEDRLVKALAGLAQTQDEGVFDNALREYRKVLVEMRQNLPAVFNETFGPVGGRAQVGTAPAAPRNTPTRADVEYLLRNRNRPSVVNGFRQHFGDAAFRQAIGGR